MDQPENMVRSTRRWTWFLIGLVCLLVGVVAFIGAFIAFESRSEYKAPSVADLVLPVGYETLDSSASGGSGGTVVRYVLVAGPAELSDDEAAVRLVEFLIEERGWTPSRLSPCSEDTPCHADQSLLERGDRRAGFATPDEVRDTTPPGTGLFEWISMALERTSGAPLEDAGSRRPLVFVELQFRNLGVGRWF